MPCIKLTAADTEKRFGVHKQIDNFPSQLTKQEEANVKVVLEYMEIAYSPTHNKGASSVSHLCLSGKNTFLAPSTFPDAHTAEEYAESHSKVMSALNDLQIIQFDIVVAKENFVSLRYTATGSHNGGPHNDIQPTQRKAQWTAAGNFVIDEETGKIQHWWKDWDKMQSIFTSLNDLSVRLMGCAVASAVWKQLGWVKPDNDNVQFA
ncbi:hypothetical protein BC835DRAFT_1269205 [Cytidiella melzeri]|nr:hypothetical protein BC835DRAFT_1269205 [Cytidiella melzeri]